MPPTAAAFRVHRARTLASLAALAATVARLQEMVRDERPPGAFLESELQAAADACGECFAAFRAQRRG